MRSVRLERGLNASAFSAKETASLNWPFIK